jgi:hypothetical protein
MNDTYLNAEQRHAIRNMGSLGLTDQNFQLALDTCDILEDALSTMEHIAKVNAAKIVTGDGQTHSERAEAPSGYFVLSLKNGPIQGLELWWRPDGAGYTTDLLEAGIYTQEEIDTEEMLFNDGVETEAVAVATMFPGGLPVMPKKHQGVRLVAEVGRVAHRTDLTAKTETKTEGQQMGESVKPAISAEIGMGSQTSLSMDANSTALSAAKPTSTRVRAPRIVPMESRNS